MTDMDRTAIEIALSKELGISSARVAVVGSSLILGTEGNDIDCLCLVNNEDDVYKIGFVDDYETHYESPMHSYRRDGMNLIATTSRSFFFAELAIAYAARLVAQDAFDLTDRSERVRFHGAIRSTTEDRRIRIHCESAF